MANVNEGLGWVSGIRQFETTDPIEGGVDGVDNIALSQLASRTKFLYDKLQDLAAPFMGTGFATPGKGWVLFNDIAANIPAGWAEVTEMRGRTAIGLSDSDSQFNAIGNIGGSKTATLNASNIPQLSVTLPRSEADNGEVDGTRVLANSSQPAGNLTISAAVGNSSPAAFSVLDPYRVVMYIKWVG